MRNRIVSKLISLFKFLCSFFSKGKTAERKTYDNIIQARKTLYKDDWGKDNGLKTIKKYFISTQFCYVLSRERP